MFKRPEGESLGGFDHVRILMTHSMSTVSMYARLNEQEKSLGINAGLKLFGVLHRWIDHWTRLPTIVLTPRALETRRAIVPQSQQPTHCYCPSFESTRRQNNSWESCPVVDPSLEHSKKLKTNVNPGFFLVLLDLNT